MQSANTIYSKTWTEYNKHTHNTKKIVKDNALASAVCPNVCNMHPPSTNTAVASSIVTAAVVENSMTFIKCSSSNMSPKLRRTSVRNNVIIRFLSIVITLS